MLLFIYAVIQRNCITRLSWVFTHMTCRYLLFLHLLIIGSNIQEAYICIQVYWERQGVHILFSSQDVNCWEVFLLLTKKEVGYCLVQGKYLLFIQSLWVVNQY